MADATSVRWLRANDEFASMYTIFAYRFVRKINNQPPHQERRNRFDQIRL